MPLQARSHRNAMWRELQPTTASYITVFKHTRRWIQSGIVHDAYASLLQEHVRKHPSKHYIVDSTYVKNAFGRVGVGRNPVDRGRKALKISALTDQDGIVHNLRCDPAKTSNVESSCTVTETQRSTLRQTSVGCTVGNDCRDKRRQRISSW